MSFLKSWQGTSKNLRGIRSRKRSRRAAYNDFCSLHHLEPRLLLSTVSWNVAASGSWTDVNNWLDDQGVKRLPTASDDVIINNTLGTFTVTISSGVQAAKSLMLLGDETLAMLNGSLTLSENSTITNFALSGGATINTTGDLMLTGNNSMSVSTVLAGPGKIFSSGVLSMTGGPSIQTELQNTGTVTMSSGTFPISGAAAKLRVLDGGLMILANSALQRPNGGQGVFIETGGTLRVTAGTNTTSGALSVDGGQINVVAGNLIFNAGTSLNNTNFNVTGGALVLFNGDQHNAVGGTISGVGAGQVIINGSSSFDLASDTVFNFAADILQFQNSAAIVGPGVLTNTGDVSGSPVLRTKVLNTGTFTPTGSVSFSATGELRILAGGIFDTAGIILAGDSSSKGLVIESGGVLSGTFASGAIPVHVLGGTVKAPSGKIVQFNGVTNIIGGTLDTTGGGAMFFQSDSNTTLGGSIIAKGGAASSILFGNGLAVMNIAAGGATLNSDPGVVAFRNLTVNGPGTLTTLGELLISSTNPTLRTELRVEGKLNLVGTNPLLFLDGPGGLLRIADGGEFFGGSNVDGHFISASNGAPGIVVEEGGLFRRSSSGQLTIFAPMDNRGTVEIAGGNMVFNGTITQISGTAGNISLNGGTWIQHGATVLNFTNTFINRIGAGADVTVGFGLGGFPSMTGVSAVAGTLRLVEGRTLIGNTQFTNSGNIILEPGTELNVGAFTQTAAGVTEFQVAGTATEQRGKIIGTAAATLGGTARIKIVNAYSPQAGQSFTLQTYTSKTGAYATIEGLNLTRTPVFEPIIGATVFSVNSLINASNLDAGTVTPPVSGIAGQNVSFSYIVQNIGTFATLATSWTDAVYLSLDDQLDDRDILLTRVTHNGALAGNATYTANVTVPLVGMLPGNYKLLVLADSRGYVADSDRTNNLSASSGTFAVDVPTLTPGVALNGTISGGQDLYYRVTLPAGQTPQFTFTGNVTGQAEIYESLGEVPTRSQYDESNFSFGSTVQRVVGTTTVAATYYILLHGREKAGVGQSFSLIADGIGFDLTSSSVTSGANVGKVTTTLAGSQFSPTTTFTLVPSSGPSRQALTTSFHDSQTMDATFDLTGLAAGTYSIVADNGGPTDTLANSFTVTNGGMAGALRYNLSVPRYVRPPFIGSMVTLTYQNVGLTDLDAPLFTLISDNARVRLNEQTGFTVGAFELLGVSGGLAGVLSPGEEGRIDIYFEPIDATAHTFSDFEVLVAGDDGQPLNFTGLKNDLRPPNISTAAWDAVFANFITAAGATVGSYHSMLVDNANYLEQFGPVSAAATRLVDFELDQAGILGQIAARYELGDFGRGQTSPLGLRAFENDLGDVTLRDGSYERTFVKLSTGLYAGTDADFGTLTRSGSGAFTLHDGDGTTTAFRASDGRIDFIENAQGRRNTAAWTAGGRLISVTDSLTGDQVLYAYNAQGRIATTTDAVGHVTTYTYDAGGEHLTAITGSDGLTTSFTYVTGQGTAREHAVASVTGPSGITSSFTYDTQGRVTQRTTGTGPLAITDTFTYDSAGKFTQTDSEGHSTVTFYGAGGALLRTVDSLGQVASAILDAQGRFVGAIDPAGVATRTNLGSTGLASGLVAADRTETQLQIGGDFRLLQSLTDPRGNKTNFSYDANGQLLQQLFPDGSSNQYEYDSAGRVAAVTDANGSRTTYTYNALGLLTQRTFADGSTISYTYSARRNLLTATDAEGTTTFTYNTADRITSVAYPNGNTITITYDAVGRRATVADQTGFTVRYSYDALGRLEFVRDTANALLVEYDYNALGELVTETRGNGSTTAYTYDAAGRQSTITHRNAGNSVIGFFNYTYDVHDRVKTVTDATGTTAYTYDLVGQLIKAELPGGRTITYAYDAQGNRTSVIDSAAGTDNYTTNNADQYTVAGGDTLSYDYAGRIIARTSGGITTSYSYGQSGELTGITFPGSVISFDYDALGNRIGRIENGVRTDFANDPLGTVFGEYQDANANAHFASGIGLTARVSSGGASFYHFDAGGNTSLLSGAGGAAVASYTYLPFGEILSQTGSSAQPFTFNGGYGVLDEAGDLYSMGARMYDAGLGRFTTRDPIGFVGGDTNLYRFVGNDPVNSVDPTGLYPPLITSGKISNPPTVYGTGLLRTLEDGTAVIGQVLGKAGLARASSQFHPNVHNPFFKEFATVSEAGRNLPAIYEGPAAVPQVVEQTAPQVVRAAAPAVAKSRVPALLAKGAQALNYLKPVAKVIAPVAKFLGSVPVQATLAVLDIATIEATWYNYLDDQGTYGHSGTDENNFSPEFYKKNGDNALLNDMIKTGMLNGMTKEQATLSALRLLNIIDNNYTREQQKKGGGAAGAAKGGSSEVIRPFDPNNIIGPAGAGADPVPDIIAPGQVRFDGFVNGASDFSYRVEFENNATASAPAQVVTITQTLDSDLDLSTFTFASFGFGDFVVNASSGIGTSFSTIVDATATLGINVRIDAEIDTLTRILTVTFTSLDPITGDVPSDPFAGFLPPNVDDPEGDGFFTYTVAPNASLPNATRFDALASIVFDTEDPIDTPAVFNTLDNLAPSSSVTPFASSTTNRPTFNIAWTAADDASGSGMASVSILYSDNGGELQTATGNNADGVFRFTGEVGHTYEFYSVAADNAGNLETIGGSPDAIITVIAPVLTTATGNTAVLTDTDGDIYTVKLTGPGTLKYATVDPDGGGPLHGPLDFLVTENTTTASSLTVTVKRKADGPDPDKLPDGDGIVTIGDVLIGGGLASFTAKTSDITTFDATGAVIKTITIRNLVQLAGLAGDPTIKTGGTAIDKLTIVAGTLADDFIITTPQQITSLTAASMGDGLITAATLAKFTTTVGAMNADLNITGAVGAVSVKTSVNEGLWSGSSFSTITVGAGAFNADVTAAGAIAGVSVKAGSLGGDLTARSIGAVSITGGGLLGNLTSTGGIVALGKTAAIASVTITGGNFAGDLTAVSKVGNITVKADKNGTGGGLSGELAAQSFGAVSLAGNMSGVFISSATLVDLGKVAGLASLTITGGNLTGKVLLAGALGTISVKTAKNGSGGSIAGATVTAAKIAGISTTLDITNSVILAGTDLGIDRAPGGGDDTFATGTIGSVSVGRNLLNSVLAAGLSNADGDFDSDDDAIIGGLASTFAALTIKGTDITGSYFAAGKFTAPPKVGASTINVATHVQFFVD